MSVTTTESVGTASSSQIQPGHPPPTLWRRFKNLVKRRAALLTGLLSVVVFLLAWELGVHLSGISRLFIAPPSDVFAKAVELFRTGVVYPHLLTSGYEVMMGFGLAVGVGVPLGIVLGRVPFLRNVFEPFLMALYSTPSVALLPLLIVWLGIGAGPKITLIFLGAVFVIIVNTEVGVSSADQKLIEAVRSFTGNTWDVLTRVELPWAMPFILAGLRLGIVRAMIMMIVGEMIMSDRGLGFMIMQAGRNFDTATLLVGILIVVIASTTLTQSLRWIEGRMRAGSLH